MTFPCIPYLPFTLAPTLWIAPLLAHFACTQVPKFAQGGILPAVHTSVIYGSNPIFFFRNHWKVHFNFFLKNLAPTASSLPRRRSIRPNSISPYLYTPVGSDRDCPSTRLSVAQTAGSALFSKSGLSRPHQTDAQALGLPPVFLCLT